MNGLKSHQSKAESIRIRDFSVAGFCQTQLDSEKSLMKFTSPRQSTILFIASFQTVTERILVFFFRQEEEILRNVGFCQTERRALVWLALCMTSAYECIPSLILTFQSLRSEFTSQPSNTHSSCTFTFTWPYLLVSFLLEF